MASLYTLGVAVMYRRFFPRILESWCTSVKNDLSSTPVVLCASSHSIMSNSAPFMAVLTTPREWYVENTTVIALSGLFFKYPLKVSTSVDTGASSSVMEPSSPVLLSEHTAR